MKKVFIVAVITGYTSEEAIFVFASRDAAQLKFNKLRDKHLIGHCEDINPGEIKSFEQLKEMPNDWLLRHDIYIGDPNADVTYDSGDVYVRIFLDEKELND